MTQGTRSFLFGSALVSAVGLCTGLVAFYSGALPLRSPAIGPPELAFLPPDTSVVAYANLQDILHSEFGEKLRQALPHGQRRDEFVAQTGIDIDFERDLDSIVIGLGTGETQKGEGVILLRGRFERGRIEQEALKRGATQEEAHGKQLFVLQVTSPSVPGAPLPSHALSETTALTFLEPGLLAFGEVGFLRRTIASGATHEDVTSNEALMGYVGEASANGNAWIVSRFGAIAANPKFPEQVKRQLTGIEWLWASAQIDRSVAGRVSVETLDDVSADNLRALVNGAVSAAKMFAGGNRALDGVLSTLQATGAGRKVEVAFTVPADVLDLAALPGGLGLPLAR